MGVSESTRAIKILHDKISTQKQLIIQSLENDCGKDELNRQIAVCLLHMTSEYRPLSVHVLFVVCRNYKIYNYSTYV